MKVMDIVTSGSPSSAQSGGNSVSRCRALVNAVTAMTRLVWLLGRFCLSFGTLRGPGKGPKTRGMRYCGLGLGASLFIACSGVRGQEFAYNLSARNRFSRGAKNAEKLPVSSSGSEPQKCGAL